MCFRSLKKKIRAEELLKSASLPPSMAARERLSKAKALSAEVLNTNSQRPKRRKHKFLNYKKRHEQIQNELEERCSNNITTSPQPFKLRTAELHKRKVDQPVTLHFLWHFMRERDSYRLKYGYRD